MWWCGGLYVFSVHVMAVLCGLVWVRMGVNVKEGRSIFSMVRFDVDVDNVCVCICVFECVWVYECSYVRVCA